LGKHDSGQFASRGRYQWSRNEPLETRKQECCTGQSLLMVGGEGVEKGGKGKDVAQGSSDGEINIVKRTADQMAKKRA